MRKKKENTFAIDIAIILSISRVSFVPHSITIAHFLPSFQRWTRSHTWILWTIVLLSRNCHSYIIATSVIQPPHPSREKYTRVRFREERTYEMDVSLKWMKFFLRVMFKFYNNWNDSKCQNLILFNQFFNSNFSLTNLKQEISVLPRNFKHFCLKYIWLIFIIYFIRKEKVNLVYEISRQYKRKINRINIIWRF